MLMSLCCDTAQSKMICLGVLADSVCCDTTQAMVFLLVPVCCLGGGDYGKQNLLTASQGGVDVRAERVMIMDSSYRERKSFCKTTSLL